MNIGILALAISILCLIIAVAGEANQNHDRKVDNRVVVYRYTSELKEIV